MAERRYTEDEITRILDRATQVQKDEGGRALSRSEGLTLAELREIGQEAGISGELIERAAAEVDRPEPRVDPNRRLVGAPIGVGRTVYLERPLSSDEWESLVVDLRETFDARGNVTEQGAFRQWNNGNLQALLEPTEDGERLRLKTVKGQGRMFLTFGGVMLLVTSVVALVPFLTGGDPSVINWEGLLPLALVGAGFMGSQYISLPGWAKKRQLQMEGVIERLTARMEKRDTPHRLSEETAGDPPAD